VDNYTQGFPVMGHVMNLASWVLVGGVVGILAGVTFGESCAILSPIGFI
jgi:hypothetical protein